jgi:hypothetical protein
MLIRRRQTISELRWPETDEFMGNFKIGVKQHQSIYLLSCGKDMIY